MSSKVAYKHFLHMTWFDIKKLETDLTEGNITEKDAFNYLLATMLLFTVLPYLSDNIPTSKMSSVIELVVGIIMTIVILKATFDINARGDNKEYLKRYISLSLVLFIRLMVYALLPSIGAVIIMKVLASIGVVVYEAMANIFIRSLSIVLVMAYYFMLTNSFKRINSRNW